MSEKSHSPSIAPLGLRERKKLETRDALADAAVKLALRDGLENLRVEDIAAEAKVSMRTFNNYFSSKNEALVARFTDRMRHAANALAARPADEPLWDAIQAAILAPWNDSARGHAAPTRTTHAELQVLYDAPAVQSEILRMALSADHPFTQAVAARTATDPATDLFPKLVTATVTAATQVAINCFLTASPTVPLVPLLQDVLAQLEAGLPMPPRRRKRAP